MAIVRKDMGLHRDYSVGPTRIPDIGSMSLDRTRMIDRSPYVGHVQAPPPLASLADAASLAADELQVGRGENAGFSFSTLSTAFCCHRKSIENYPGSLEATVFLEI